MADTSGGAAPLTVNFTIDAMDEDDDELTWSLDADGDGTEDESGDSFPSIVPWTFDVAGNFTATLTVDDGLEEDTATAAITVTDAAAGFTPVHADLDFTVLCEACTDAEDPTLCVSLQADEPGLDCNWLALAPEAAGRIVTVGGTGTPQVSPNGAFTTDCSATGTVVSAFYGAPPSGPVPAGAACLIVWDYFGAVTGTITVDIV